MILSSRRYPCAVCAAPVDLLLVTTARDGAPELLRLESDAWVAADAPPTTDPPVIVVCSTQCAKKLLAK